MYFPYFRNLLLYRYLAEFDLILFLYIDPRLDR